MRWWKERKYRKAEIERKVIAYDRAHDILWRYLDRQIEFHIVGTPIDVWPHVYDLYEALSHPSARFENVDLAEAGRTNLLFKGFPIVRTA